MSEISGVTTMQTPSIAIAGTWKQIDFPPPVGSRARVSFPLMTESTMSSCIGRNDGYPQYLTNTARVSSLMMNIFCKYNNFFGIFSYFCTRFFEFLKKG